MPTQGSDPLSKEDTQFRGESPTAITAELLVDRSQHGDDWTRAGVTNVIYSAQTSGFAPVWPRTIELSVELDDAPFTRTLWSTGGNPHTDANSHGITVFSSAGSQLRIYINGNLSLSMAPPNIQASLQRFAIVWATKVNPDALGPFDALYSELQVWNVDTGAFDTRAWVHEVPNNPASPRQFLGGYDTAGTQPFAGSIWDVRIGAGRFHAAIEGSRDWASTGSAPVVTLLDEVVPLAPPSTIGMGYDGRASGPVAKVCSAAIRGTTLRLLGPAVNIVYQARPWIYPTYSGFYEDSMTWRGTTILTPYYLHCPAPPGANRVRVRVFVQTDMSVTSLDTGDDACFVRAFCAERAPLTVEDEEFNIFTAVTLPTGNDDNGDALAGDWLEFEEMTVHRDADGDTHILIGVHFTGTALDQRLRICAIAADFGTNTETP